MAGRSAPDAQLTYVERSRASAILLMRLGARPTPMSRTAFTVDYIAAAYPDQLEVLPETYSSDAICFGVRKGKSRVPALARPLRLHLCVVRAATTPTYAKSVGRGRRRC